MPFWCLQISQKISKILLVIFALASKKRSNQKSSVRESKQNPPISDIKYPYFFDLTTLEAREEIQNIFLHILVQISLPIFKLYHLFFADIQPLLSVEVS